MKKQKNLNRGFTLVEVLVASVILVTIGIAIIGMQRILTQSQVLVWNAELEVDQANRGVQTLVREIRTARPSDLGAFPIELTYDQQLIFYSDIDYDGKSERVRYFLTGPSLKKGVIEPVGFPASYPSANEKINVISENVRNKAMPVFYYYNGDWPQDKVNNPLSLAVRVSKTKLMRVYLRLNTKDDEPDKDFILESYAQIRMLKDNL